MINIAINGFGRIGRVITKINELSNKYNIVAINDINPNIDNMSYLLKYDSTYGKSNMDIKNDDQHIYINKKAIRYYSYEKTSEVPWNEHDIDVIIDASGIDNNVILSQELIDKKIVKKVIVTHSNLNVDKEIILGVNCHELKEEHNIVSNSICDANAISHIVKWIEEEFGILSGSVTTSHPWLSYQNLVDGPSISQSNPTVVWKDYALGRSSVDSLIPKHTTAITAVEKVLPKIKDKFLSFSYRVPTDIVSSSDIVINTKKDTTLNSIKNLLKTKSDNSPYVRLNYDSCVSIDYKGDNSSAIIDMQWLQVNHNMIKVIIWYDNEWGYGCRTLDLVEKLL